MFVGRTPSSSPKHKPFLWHERLSVCLDASTGRAAHASYAEFSLI